MGIEAPAEVKYEIIHAAVSGNCLLNISALCKMAGVSRSGYYHWISQESYRKECEERDRNDFDLILAAFRRRGYKKGARSIYMTLLRNKPPVIMNIKKIRRLMKKYGLKCPFRGPNPYKQMAKATEESTVAPNLVKREFRKHGPRKVLLTDITYLFFGNEKCYLSVIKDAYTKEVLAYVVSMTMVDDIVKDTLEQLMAKHGSTLTKDTIIHSDQGSQYKSRKIADFLKDHELQRSMSRKANCWDNAPQESFFGHMKDEIDLSECASFQDVVAVIDDYMDYYNTERYQWDLAKLAPAEYYQYCLTGDYPLVGICKPPSRGSAPGPEV